MIKINNILFPCDLKETSMKLVPYVQSFSEKYGSKIYMLHVVENISKWGGFYIPNIPLELYQQEAEQAAQKFMNKICEKYFRGRSNIHNKVISGDPATEILKAIDTEPIDLVVMGTNGLNGSEHAIFGSVAEIVVKESAIPVLAINPFKLKSVRV